MTTVCIHQPDFAPWLGFFDRLRLADIYIVFDDVQFLRRAWHHRDRILAAKGSQWLTVPVIKKGRYTQTIRDVEIDNGRPWQRRHLRTLQTIYGRRPGFHATCAALEGIYAEGHTHLLDLNMAIIRWMLSIFDIDVEVIFSSELFTTSHSTQRLVDLMKSVGGTHYITGSGARDYLDTELFSKNDIDVLWQNFTHPVYDQDRDHFEPMLSSLDALCHGAAPFPAPPGKKELQIRT